MKKIFTLMLACACALFAGVSCVADDTDAPAVPVVTVEAPEAGLLVEPAAGTLEVNYVVENPVNGAEVKVAVSEVATWLTAGEPADGKVVLSYEANEEVAAREAVVTFSYEGAESVEVKVKQAGKTSLTVTGQPEANLTAAAGEFTLGYVMNNASMTAQLVVTVNEEAAWLHYDPAKATETTITLSYDANNSDFGSEPREATITLSFEGAEPVVVTVKQDAPQPSFAVEFPEVSSNYAIATLTAVDQNMDWLCLLATTTSIVEGGYTTPKEYIDGLCAMAKAEGMPYLLLMSQIYQAGGAMGKGDSVDPIYCQLPYNAQQGDKLYMFVLGFNVDADMNDWSYDNSTLATPAHVFEVPLLPAPVVNVQTENTVSCAAGPLVLDVTIENPVEVGEISVSTNDAWVTPSYADGKLTLAYEANTTALSRKATISVEYGKKTFWGEGPDDWYMEPLCNPVDVVLVQEADPNANVVTFDIQVVETHFDRIVVNVIPSDKEAEYVLSATPATEKNWETEAWEPITVDWLQTIHNTPLDTTYKGDLTNHPIMMSVGNYEWYGYDYYVYAFAVNADKSAPAGEASHTESSVKIDLSDMPKLTFVEGNGLTWNAEEGYYELKTNGVEQEYVLSFNIENPVEGAAVTYNSSATGGVIDESWGTDVFANGDQLVIDNEAKTVKFTVNPYPADWNKSYAPNRSFTVFYTLGDAYWGIQEQVKVILCPADSGAVMPL